MSNFTMKSYNGRRIGGCDYSHALYELLPDIIGAKPMTVSDIALACGRHVNSVHRAIQQLYDNEAIHIAAWCRGERGPITAMYQWGKGEDASRPMPLTSTQKCRRYRRSIAGKTTRETYRTSKKLETGGLAAIDPLLAALMGRRNQPEKEL